MRNPARINLQGALISSKWNSASGIPSRLTHQDPEKSGKDTSSRLTIQQQEKSGKDTSSSLAHQQNEKYCKDISSSLTHQQQVKFCKGIPSRLTHQKHDISGKDTIIYRIWQMDNKDILSFSVMRAVQLVVLFSATGY